MKRVISAIVMIVLVCMGMSALAEKEHYPAYVICQPESFVYMRSKPRFKSEEVAYLYPGDEVETDGKTNGGWVHVYYSCEAGEGWIYKSYICYDKPTIYRDGITARTEYKKVRARRNIDGKIRHEMKKGTELIAYVVSDEWTVTNMGFVKTKYLSFDRQ